MDNSENGSIKNLEKYLVNYLEQNSNISQEENDNNKIKECSNCIEKALKEQLNGQDYCYNITICSHGNDTLETTSFQKGFKSYCFSLSYEKLQIFLYLFISEP